MGRLAASVDELPLQGGIAKVVAVMVRTRCQTPDTYWPSLHAEECETPLVEVQLEF